MLRIDGGERTLLPFPTPPKSAIFSPGVRLTNDVMESPALRNFLFIAIPFADHEQRPCGINFGAFATGGSDFIASAIWFYPASLRPTNLPMIRHRHGGGEQ